MKCYGLILLHLLWDSITICNTWHVLLITLYIASFPLFFVLHCFCENCQLITYVKVLGFLFWTAFENDAFLFLAALPTCCIGFKSIAGRKNLMRPSRQLDMQCNKLFQPTASVCNENDNWTLTTLEQYWMWRNQYSLIDHILWKQCVYGAQLQKVWKMCHFTSTGSNVIAPGLLQNGNVRWGALWFPWSCRRCMQGSRAVCACLFCSRLCTKTESSAGYY